jgi:hypothetical protein
MYDELCLSVDFRPLFLLADVWLLIENLLSRFYELMQEVEILSKLEKRRL